VKTQYLEQLERIKRLMKKLALYAEITDTNYAEAVDEFTSYFIQCYHLRDWLIRSGFSQSSVDDLIKSSKHLSLCRDLANKQKHHTIDRYVPKNSFVDLGRNTPITRFADHFDHGKIKLGIDIWEYGQPIEALSVAHHCLEEWSSFLEKQKNIGSKDKN